MLDSLYSNGRLSRTEKWQKIGRGGQATGWAEEVGKESAQIVRIQKILNSAHKFYKSPIIIFSLNTLFFVNTCIPIQVTICLPLKLVTQVKREFGETIQVKLRLSGLGVSVGERGWRCAQSKG